MFASYPRVSRSVYVQEHAMPSGQATGWVWECARCRESEGYFASRHGAVCAAHEHSSYAHASLARVRINNITVKEN